MATRSDKRRRRMMARKHQADVRGTTKMVEYDGKTTINVPRGPRATPSYSASDPPKHGDRLDARGVAEKALREIGVQDPDPEACREFQRLVKATGSVGAAKRELTQTLERAERKAKKLGGGS
ncbi:MAG: hypothetical protein H0U16_07525 [Actinobacteria bacterium]|nr:hypothetical protein [Actinomycetota bacterium]